MLICEECKNQFVPKTSRQKFCTRACTSAFWKEKLRRGYRYDRFTVFTRDGFKCQYCGRNPKEDNIKLQVDHIKPQSRGGSNELDNLTTACEDCNLGKSDVLLRATKKLRNKPIDVLDLH